MRTTTILLVLLGIIPVAPLPAGATLSSIEVTLDQATVWRSRSKLGRIKAAGTFRSVGGQFDKTRIIVTVADGQDLDESGEFTSCKTFPSGTVRCQNDDRTSRLRYIPDSADPNLYRYRLDYRRRDIAKPQVEPLKIEFVYDGTLRAAAKNAPCRVYNAKLLCKGDSMACTPEVCDGVDNDCNGQVDDGLGQSTCGVGECERTVDNCAGGVEQTCTAGTPAPETCDGLDNDCDGGVDTPLTLATCGLGACASTEVCANGTLIPCAPGQPQPELCGDDSVDNDCDGVAGCSDADCASQPVCSPSCPCSGVRGTPTNTEGWVLEAAQLGNWPRPPVNDKDWGCSPGLVFIEDVVPVVSGQPVVAYFRFAFDGVRCDANKLLFADGVLLPGDYTVAGVVANDAQRADCQETIDALVTRDPLNACD